MSFYMPTLLSFTTVSVMCSLVRVRFIILFIILTVNSTRDADTSHNVISGALLSKQNCSQYVSDPFFELYQFRGKWNYVNYFSFQISNPRCMTLKSRIIKDTKIHMNISLQINPSIVAGNSKDSDSNPNHNPNLNSDSENSEKKDKVDAETISLIGYVEMSKSRTDIPGTWSLYSDLSLAPSKWIVLSGDRSRVLYMICGDYPDQTSRVGEIGILSRDTSLPYGEVTELLQILDTYGLSVTLPEVLHTNCGVVL